ncbi:MAG: hypothetical protein MK214_03755 [Thalassotalea sp.]|nr:hypothetical protein [Thalassotalea sp.]
MRELNTNEMEQVNGGLLERGEASWRKFQQTQAGTSQFGFGYTMGFAQFASTLGSTFSSNYDFLNQLLAQLKENYQKAS